MQTGYQGHIRVLTIFRLVVADSVQEVAVPLLRVASAEERGPR